jgi:cullin-associated NEDD8-dissociated protein 1
MMAKLSSFEISSQQSALFRLLCNPDAAGACQLKSKITLSQNIPCFGIECEVDVIRTVKLKVSSTDFLYYEYVQQPCVNLEFPESGILTKGRNGDYPFCSDSTAIKASPACCSSGSLIAQERVKFEGETTTFDSSVKICSNFNQTLCDFGSVNVGSPQNPNNFAWSASRFWTSSKCNVSIQVFADGRVSLLHTNPSWTGTTFYGLQQNSNVKIRVGWLNSKFPVASNQCDGICQSIDGTCICGTSVVTRAVFTDSRRIPTVEDILQNLKIGAVDPSTFDAGFYSIAHQDSQKGLKVYEDSSKMFNENTIFEIRSIGTRVQYFANLKSTVELSSSSYSFRNPPNFMQHDERTLRDAEYEVDALLYHLLYHQSTAPFVADFLIKRFVTSNPSPNYVETVSNAFISGQYNGFGSGKYGDLASTFAAVLLYRDSISHVVKSDKFHGLIREPVIKVLHFMRALELRSTINSDFELGYWDNVLGQEVFMSPTVFNFYQSDFQPAGDIAQAKLFAPEAQSLNYPKTVAFTNTMINLVHFGLSSCFKGLSQSLKFENNDSTSLCYSFNDSNPSGTFSFEHYKSSSNFRELIIQLNTLLLGGRLDSYRQDVLLSLYEKAKVSASIDYAVKKVISALTITPEYQITSTAPVNLTASKKPSVSLDASGGYKAIVYVFLEGGMDSYNLLVPHSTCAKSDLYSQYAQIRQNGAISKSDLLLIDVPNWASTQPCQKFGINMAMPQVHQLYNSGEAAFIANIGTLVESLNSSEYYKGTKRQPVGIFAHNIQQKLARNLVSDSYEAKGILGKLKESLYRNNRSSKSYALRGYFAPILEGEDPKKTPQTILNPFGNVETLDEFFLYTSLNQYLWNLTSAVSDSVFGNTWNDIFQSSVSEASKLNDLLKFTPASSSYMNHYVSNQFNYASRIMSNRKKLNSATDIFYLEMNGFDSHDSFISFGNNARILDSGLKSFTEDLKAKGLWENVTIVVASEFGRTLRSNGYGSDHRWGGNAFILGESVKGGQILGSFPSDMQDLSEFNIGNGIFVPTSPWEAIWKPLLKWFDLSDAEIQAILPNMKNFDQEKLFSFDSVFKRLNSYSTPNDPPSLGYTIREKNGNTALLTDNEGILYAQSLSGSYRPIIPLHYKSFKDTGDFEVAAAENIDGLNYIVWRTLNADFALVIWTMDENSRILNNEYKPIFKGTLIYYEAERKFQEDFDIDGKISTP